MEILIFHVRLESCYLISGHLLMKENLLSLNIRELIFLN